MEELEIVRYLLRIIGLFVLSSVGGYIGGRVASHEMAKNIKKAFNEEYNESIRKT